MTDENEIRSYNDILTDNARLRTANSDLRIRLAEAQQTVDGLEQALRGLKVNVDMFTFAYMSGNHDAIEYNSVGRTGDVDAGIDSAIKGWKDLHS